MIIVPVKPMSVNRAWLGAKRKSKEYRIYEQNVMDALPESYSVPKKGTFRLKMDVYFSNSRADIDNSLKPFIDILQKKYGFDDCRIYHISVWKYICKKGEERIEFQLEDM